MQQTSRLDFLFNAGQAMFAACPSLSRYYMSEFQDTMEGFELKATKPIEKLTCQSCGQIQIAGLNSQVRIVQKNRQERKKAKRRSSNRVETTCLVCQRVKIHYGSQKNKMLQLREIKPVAVIDKGNQKKKTKNKNKNNLKTLLAKQQQPASNNSSGSLGDFLSGL
ncbi:hypothetical protein BY458DRAFT_535241 [Sporodiniella umbellata]|nr:hypothetical protein BY458DRAFT_535241 [Sporodiniella umbellata]